MKATVISAIATTMLLLVGSGASAAHSSQVDGNPIEYRPGTGQDKFDDTEAEPTMLLDRDVYEWGEDGGVAFAAPDSSSYSYDGEWDGEYVDPHGRVFEGDWNGRVVRHGSVSGPGHPAPERPDHAGAPYAEPDRRNDDDYEAQRRHGHGHAPVIYSKHHRRARHGNGYAWQGGYYYYPHATMVTVVTSAPVTTTTTTVTEEYYYERVAAPRRKAVRKWKPKPKPHCVCR